MIPKIIGKQTKQQYHFHSSLKEKKNQIFAKKKKKLLSYLAGVNALGCDS